MIASECGASEAKLLLAGEKQSAGGVDDAAFDQPPIAGIAYRLEAAGGIALEPRVEHAVRHDEEWRSRSAERFVHQMGRQTWPKPKPVHDHGIKPRHVRPQPGLQSRRVGKPHPLGAHRTHRKGIPPDPRRSRWIAADDLVLNVKAGERGDRLADSLRWAAVGGVHAGDDAKDFQWLAPDSLEAMAF